MGFLTDIISLFNEPKGPVYSCSDLEWQWKEWKEHERKAMECFDKAMTGSMSAFDILVEYRLHSELFDAMGRCKHTYVNTIASWIEHDFVPKLRKYDLTPAKQHSFVPGLAVSHTVCEHRDKVFEGMAHIEACEDHAKKIDDMLHFFFCDTRCVFDKRRALEEDLGYPCSPDDVRRWYIDGKHVVKANMERVSSFAKRFEEYMRQRGRKWDGK